MWKIWIVHRITLISFTGSVLNGECYDAEYNNDATENGNFEDLRVAIGETSQSKERALKDLIEQGDHLTD